MNNLRMLNPGRTRRILGVATVPAAFLLIAALLLLDTARSPCRDFPVSVDGNVQESGAVPGDAPAPAGLATWSTWNGDDNGFGRLAFGPFHPPPHFSIFLRGYPRVAGNSVALENPRTGESIPLSPQVNPGEAWVPLEIEVPRAWRSDAVTLLVIDQSVGWGAWMAVTQPCARPWWAAWWRGIMPRVAVFAMVGLGIWLVTAAARLWLAHILAEADERIGIAAWGIAGALGYVVFWLHFLGPGIGRAVPWAVLAAALATHLHAALRRDASAVRTRSETCDSWAPTALAAAVGLVLFASLHLHQVEPAIARLAATRLGSLPADNEIPQVFAERLLQGLSPRNLFGDWLSSDRPPLQTGWQLLFAQPALSVGIDFDDAMQCAGIWFQLLWVPSAWAWLRRMGLTAARAALIVLAVTPCTMIFLNTVFVWPKLGAAGLLIGAFTFWVRFGDSSPPARAESALGGMLAGSAWVSHGGVAFALLPLALLLAFRLRHLGSRQLLSAGVVFALFALPWSAYQKFYEPPGNRLLKWHLAGQIAIDERGTMETLRDAYARTPFAVLAEGRRENLATIFRGEWRELATFSTRDTDNRKASEATYIFFALGWWNLGWPVIVALVCVPRCRRQLAEGERRGLLLGPTWGLATLVVWVALMFVPGSTLFHQGSYTAPLVWLLVLAAALLRVHPAAMLVVAAAQLAGFILFTLPASPATPRLPWRFDSSMVLLIGAGAAVVIATICRRTPDPVTQQV